MWHGFQVYNSINGTIILIMYWLCTTCPHFCITEPFTLCAQWCAILCGVSQFSWHTYGFRGAQWPIQSSKNGGFKEDSSTQQGESLKVSLFLQRQDVGSMFDECGATLNKQYVNVSFLLGWFVDGLYQPRSFIFTYFLLPYIFTINNKTNLNAIQRKLPA